MPYSAEKDVMIFTDQPTALTAVGSGEFAVSFFPEDAHLPLIADGELRKVVPDPILLPRWACQSTTPLAQLGHAGQLDQRLLGRRQPPRVPG